MRRSPILVVLAMIFTASPGGGQSLFSSKGLGMPVEPFHARTRALGMSGLGLLGPSLSPTDIASAARIFLPTAQLTIQPQWIDGSLGEESIDTRATRIPHLSLAYPVGRFGGTAVLFLGSYMDQRWEVEETSVQEFRGTEVPVTDVFRSDGGISTVQVGWAQRLGETLSVGLGVGSRIGSVTRRFQRVIEAEGAFDVVPFETAQDWQYSGLTTSLTVQWDPIEALRLGGALTLSQDLKAEPRSDSEEGTLTFDLPTKFRIGASGILTPRVAVSAGLTYSDWGSSSPALDADALTGSVWSYGGGLEWTGPTWGIRSFPVRIGVKRSDLPFTFDGTSPTETLLSAGLGFNFVPPTASVVGALDMSVERGDREAGSLSESFWRVSLTFRVGGF